LALFHLFVDDLLEEHEHDHEHDGGRPDYSPIPIATAQQHPH